MSRMDATWLPVCRRSLDFEGVGDCQLIQSCKGQRSKLGRFPASCLHRHTAHLERKKGRDSNSKQKKRSLAAPS